MESHQNPFTDPMSSFAVAHCPPHSNSEANLMNTQVTALKLNCPRAEYVLTGCPVSLQFAHVKFIPPLERILENAERTCVSAASLKTVMMGTEPDVLRTIYRHNILLLYKTKTSPSATPIHANKSQLTSRKEQFRG